MTQSKDDETTSPLPLGLWMLSRVLVGAVLIAWGTFCVRRAFPTLGQPPTPKARPLGPAPEMLRAMAAITRYLESETDNAKSK